MWRCWKECGGRGSIISKCARVAIGREKGAWWSRTKVLVSIWKLFISSKKRSMWISLDSKTLWDSTWIKNKSICSKKKTWWETYNLWLIESKQWYPLWLSSYPRKNKWQNKKITCYALHKDEKQSKYNKKLLTKSN